MYRHLYLVRAKFLNIPTHSRCQDCQRFLSYIPSYSFLDVREVERSISIARILLQLQEFIDVYKESNQDIMKLCEKICDTSMIKIRQNYTYALEDLQQELLKTRYDLNGSKMSMVNFEGKGWIIGYV